MKHATLPLPVVLALAGALASGTMLPLADGLASELEPAALVVVTSADSVAVTGSHFALSWSRAAGGDLTSIRLFDGIEWHELVAAGIRRNSVPGILVYTPDGPLGPFSAGSIRIEEQTPERVVVACDTRLATEAGKETPLALRTTYTIHSAGAVFLDLALNLPEKSKPITVTKASLGMQVDTGTYTLSFWHWQRNRDRGSGMLEPQPVFTTPFCPNVGLALGTAGSLSNQLQVIAESPHSLKGSEVQAVSAVRDGKNFATWILPEQEGPFELVAPYTYEMKWGFLLGVHPLRSRLTGHRLAHWIEEQGDGMVFPSSSAITAMARAGATGLVLGGGWRAQGGRIGNVPLDEPEFRRTIDEVHAAGMRCLATVLPGGDGEAVGLWARDSGLDGLFIEQASAHYAALAARPTDFPGRESFAWMQGVRRGLGPSGILITHSGLEVPDLTFGLLADGVSFGEERADWRAARSTLANAYLGGSSYATPCPLATTVQMQTARAMAIAAATGSVPLVALGFNEGRSAYAARHALPLWQVMRLVPPGPQVEVRTTGITAVSASSNLDFWSVVYRMSDDAALLVTANLSLADQDSTAIWVDFPALGYAGDYAVEMLSADTIEGFSVTHLGTTQNGRLRTDAIVRHGIRAFLFVRGSMPDWIAQGLDLGLKTSSVYFDQRPPQIVTGVEVKPVTVGLGVSWEPATDNQHVASYHIYRGPDPSFQNTAAIQAVAQVFEQTHYRDLAVDPGETWSYAVAAADVNGNEGPPSQPVTGAADRGSINFSFADPADTEDFVVLSGTWTIHEGEYGFGCSPDATRRAQTLLGDSEFTDLDVAVKIEGYGSTPFAGGLLIRGDSRGNGVALLLTGTQHHEAVIARIAGDQIVPIETAYFPYVRPGLATHALRITARGELISAWIDDRKVLSATVPVDEPGSGRIGLIALQGHVHFDNLMVSPASTAGQAP